MALKILADNGSLAANLCSTVNLSIHGFFSESKTNPSQKHIKLHKIPDRDFKPYPRFTFEESARREEVVAECVEDNDDNPVNCRPGPAPLIMISIWTLKGIRMGGGVEGS